MSNSHERKVIETGDTSATLTRRPAWVRAIETTVVGLEVLPTNEAARIAIGGLTYAVTKDSAMTALAYGASTMAIEGGAAILTADLLATNTSNKAIGWVNGKLQKLGISPEAKTNKLVKAGVAVLGGSSVLLAVKQREEPERVFKQNRKYGLNTSAALAGMCAVQGYAVAEGISYPSPETIGVAGIALGGVFAAAKWAKNKVGSDG